ncbi:hypothetical protein HZP59_08745 [Elizabethkingia anophelis]|nr:hypothetical protein [Elizabethkingia anophelis]
MKKVSNNFVAEVTEDNIEIDVEVHYRCFINEFTALYPMEVSGTIYKGYSLEDFKNESKKNYEKDYMKVEIVDVFIDL